MFYKMQQKLCPTYFLFLVVITSVIMYNFHNHAVILFANFVDYLNKTRSSTSNSSMSCVTDSPKSARRLLSENREEFSVDCSRMLFVECH